MEIFTLKTAYKCWSRCWTFEVGLNCAYKMCNNYDNNAFRQSKILCWEKSLIHEKSLTELQCA